MINRVIEKIPDKYKDDVNHAVEILKSGGCKEIFIFGSLVNGEVTDNSDIDLAVRGCPPGQYFGLLGKLLMELSHPVDLIDLDKTDIFSEYLLTKGELVHVA